MGAVMARTFRTRAQEHVYRWRIDEDDPAGTTYQLILTLARLLAQSGYTWTDKDQPKTLEDALLEFDMTRERLLEIHDKDWNLDLHRTVPPKAADGAVHNKCGRDSGGVGKSGSPVDFLQPGEVW